MSSRISHLSYHNGDGLIELKKKTRQIVDNKIHGISFSPYIDGQGPGSEISEAQIHERLKIIVPHVNWVRSFSCTEGHENIPKIAKEYGLKTMVGVWIDHDKEKNEIEFINAIEVAKAGHVDVLAIGNEVLLRGDLSEDDLIDYINRAKEALPNVEVGYVDAYFLFENHPRVTDACQVVMTNCYPFWEGCPADFAVPYMKEMYHRAMKVGNGKRVIVSETGWPNQGVAERGAIPSEMNAMKYFIDTFAWAEEENIEVFYFSSFDEAWKVEDEGAVGAYWGLWDKDGNFKYNA
ncbi:glycosyl hydrolase [Enterovibrio norvegicus FF-33]|uniref:Endo-1,3-beta-glucanase btgC n=1 Tax=Enterovibrio norvegicus FF-454 TaxID=1185651 RepID=A0A1E5BY38_9GAMM|nr:glycosyl hydrolase family 17 protein [Enterovibrio norvegicus]OEE58158.1 glycosyl hydrolase [Enterovibrio norvegicus FF-454]OEE66022.1 glycosyl hydrolase [Enterovibrio norvegicus FF-33]